MKNKIITFSFFLLIISSVFSQEKDTMNKPAVISIKDAINKGMLELKICGSYDRRFFYEVLDGEGVHYGKCMAIVLKSKIDSFVFIKLDCGTLLIPDDSMVQTMLVTNDAEFPLYPGQTYSTRFYAMCAQIHDKAPDIETIFRIGEMADSNLLRLANYLDANYLQNMLGQHAVWAMTDQADFEELKKYGADSNSVIKTKEILNELNLTTKLTAQFSKSEVIRIKTYQFYLAIGAFLILIAIVTIQIIIKNKKESIS